MKFFVAVYDDFSNARQAVDELVHAGISRDKISLIANDVREEHTSLTHPGFELTKGKE